MGMAFNLLLMGKSVFLGAFPIVGGLEWITISKCLISEGKRVALTSFPVNTCFWCVAQDGLSLLIVPRPMVGSCWPHYWLKLEFLFMALLLSQSSHPRFGQRCLWWTYWSSCASLSISPLIFPWSPSLLVYLSHAFLPAFSFLISASSISPCPPATPNYSISNLIANFCLLLIDAGIYRF